MYLNDSQPYCHSLALVGLTNRFPVYLGVS